jgi:acyl-CoA thioester hydrolase
MPRITVPVQLRFGDFDPLNHVTNVAYYSIMETGRIEAIRSTYPGLVGNMVIAHSECDYRQEIRGGTRKVDVVISIEKVGRTSFTILHEIFNGEVLSAVGRTVQVVLGPERRPRPITDEERSALLAD